MALLPILQWPDAGLSTPCALVAPQEDLGTLIADMFQTMYAAPGRGLAAPQVGVLQRVFVMDATWKDGPGTPLAMINPEILTFGAELATGDEGCLSIPGVMAPVLRPSSVTLRWQDEARCWQTGTFEGFAARCIQHEYDHLDGLVTLDRLVPEARVEAEETYRRYLERPA
ncbi:peptide deformylase [Pseudophaeobacter arcticus]|uniref:peptide deformylase n=1 Tax=Pseudophaeobacter arcticus TaxID=385492 RepID=UPI003A97A685